MAQLTHQGFITIQDKAGLKSTMVVHIPIATGAVDALDFIDDLIDLVDPMILGGVVGGGITLAADIAGHGAIGPTSNVQEKGEFTWNTLNAFLHSVGVPTFDEDLVVAASRVIDVADAAVSPFLTAMKDGIVVTSTNTIIPTDSRGEDLVDLKSALERFRRR